MTVLPVVHRELLVRARQPATHRARWLAAGLALVVMLPVWMARFPDPARMGSRLFAWLAVLALAGCLIEGARQTADCLSQEKREGTLGLLFLTRLSAWDVVLGKLAATSLNSIYGFLAIMPVLGLPLLTGGVSGGEFGRMVLALVVTLFLAQAVGLFTSSLSLDELRSLFTALGMIGALTLLSPALDLFLNRGLLTGATATVSLCSPGMACHLAFDAAYRAAPRGFWCSIAIIHGLSWGLLLATSILVHKKARTAVGVSPASERPSTTTGPLLNARRKNGRRRLLETQPVRWLARRHPGIPWWIWLALAAAAVIPVGRWLFALVFPAAAIPTVGWGLLGFLQQAAALIFRLLIAFLACRFFAQERRSGGLETLLTTPLRREAILSGQQRAFWDRLFGPMIIVLLLQHLIPVALRSFRAGWMPPASLPYLLTGAGWAFLWSLIALLADAMALGWFGAWMALRSRNLAGAVARTLFAVVIGPGLLIWVIWSVFSPLPASTLLIPGAPALSSALGLLLSPFTALVVKDLILAGWARRQLHLAGLSPHQGVSS